MTAPYGKGTRLKIVSTKDGVEVSEGEIVEVVTEEPGEVKETITVKKDNGNTLQLMGEAGDNNLVSASGRKVNVEVLDDPK